MKTNEKKHLEARRKLLKGVAAGGGAIVAGKTLPDNWSRPMVDSVLLPAHAQMSLNSFTGNSNQAAVDTGSRVAQIMNNMVNEAQAKGHPLYDATEICIRSDGPGTVRVDAIINDYNYFGSMNASASGVPVGGGFVAMFVTPCDNDNRSSALETMGLINDAHAGKGMEIQVDVQVASTSGSAVGQFGIASGSFSVPFNLPPGDCTAPDCGLPVV